jgi:hypothetical protein
MTETVDTLQRKAETLEQFLATWPNTPDALPLRVAMHKSIGDAQEKHLKLLGVNAEPDGEGPIAWPSDDAVRPGIIAGIDSAVERGLLPTTERRQTTAGGPVATFPPPNGFSPFDKPSVPPVYVAPPVLNDAEKESAAIRAEYEARIAAIQAKYAPPTPEPMPRKKIPASPKIGICICTHASIPYVHLGLEALRRNEPDVPVLIHDDCSKDYAALEALAARYGASIVSTVSRRVRTVGDLSGFVEALRWGAANRLDVAIKCSRRMILNKPWSVELGALMHNTQMPTATGACGYWQWGFRAELVAMHIPSWMDCGAFAMMEEAVRRNEEYAGLPEAYDHDRAKEAYRWLHPADDSVSRWTQRDHPECDFTVRYEKTFTHNENHDGFVPWLSVMGLHRNQRVPGVLWHDNASPIDYAMLAQSFGLSYTEQDFKLEPGQ